MVFRIHVLLVPFLGLLCGALLGQDFAEQLNKRYAPYADWENVFSAEELDIRGDLRWWRSPEEILSVRAEADLPLVGLHLAIDPGHIGGEWAEAEGRHFRIAEDDYPVREGELVLEVALRLRERLTDLGAEVSLLRDGMYQVNPRPPIAYLESALARRPYSGGLSLSAFIDYSDTIRGDMLRASIVVDELKERARRVNEEIRPDAVLSLHINASRWPLDEDGKRKYELVDSNHTHVLIFGSMGDGEMVSPLHQAQLKEKMTNGSGPVEAELGHELGVALGDATALPASKYSGRNAVLLEGRTPYLWARNLLMLRYIECPVVLLEPYVANSREAYPRIQDALHRRSDGLELAEDDILLEYTRGVVEGLLAVYGAPVY